MEYIETMRDAGGHAPPKAGARSERRHAGQTGRSIWGLLRNALAFPPSIIVASLFINLFGLALPLVVLQIFDRVLQNQSFNTLILLLAGLFVVILAETALRFARDTLVSRIALAKGFEINLRTLHGFLAAPRFHLAKLRRQQTLDALCAPDDLAAFLGGNARLALLDFPFVLLFLAMIWVIGGPVAVPPAILIAVFAAWTIWSSANLKKTLEEQMHAEHERFRFYAEALDGIATVKSLAIEPQMQRRLERTLRNGAMNDYRLVLRSNRMLTMAQLFSSLTMIAVASLGGLLAIQGEIGLGAVAACTLIANRVTMPVLRITSVWGQFEAGKLARERLDPLLNLPAAEAAAKLQGPAEMHFQDVAMLRGEGASAPGFTLTVERGETVTFVTPNDNERMELIAMMRGLQPPDQGRIFIDGVDVYASDGNIAVGIFAIDGEPVIFNGSILDNVSMFRSGVEQIKAVATLRRLGLEPVIKQLTGGYDTKLGDQAATALPMDLLRAIVLARAVAARPRILLASMPPLSPDDALFEQFRRGLAELKGVSTIIRVAGQASDVDTEGRTIILRHWSQAPAAAATATLSEQASRHD